jgi:hypothetical protein
VEEMRALIFFLDYEVPLVKLHGNFWGKLSQGDGLHRTVQTYSRYEHKGDYFRLCSQWLRCAPCVSHK